MYEINKDYISIFLNGIDSSTDFAEIFSYAKENNVPIIRKETSSFLKVLMKILKPKNILEIGTAIGYSALIMKKYSDAEITTIELSKKNYEIAKSNFKKYSYDINIINEDAKKALNTINQGFDFVFTDAEKTHYKYYFDKVKILLNHGGVILCDNVLFKGMIANDDLISRREITIVNRMRKFLAYISDLKEYKTSIVPLGDGISISVKE